MYETYGTVAASDVVRTSLLSLYGSVAGFLPRLIAAIIVFLVGWLVAILIANWFTISSELFRLIALWKELVSKKCGREADSN